MMGLLDELNATLQTPLIEVLIHALQERQMIENILMTNHHLTPNHRIETSMNRKSLSHPPSVWPYRQ